MGGVRCGRSVGRGGSDDKTPPMKTHASKITAGSCRRFAPAALAAIAAAVAFQARAAKYVALRPVEIRHLADTYLQSDGTQAIDLECHVSPQSRIVAVFEPVSTNGTTYVFGSAFSSSSDFQEGCYMQNGEINFLCGDLWSGTGNAWGLGSGIKATRSRFTADLDIQNSLATLKSGDSTVWSKTITSTRTKTDNIPLHVFANPHPYTQGGQLVLNPRDFSSVKLYSLAVYDDGTLVRDLVPYGRGATTGLLDRVSGKIYENSRTGANPFILGTDDGYVASDRTKNGGQWFDTGFNPGPNTKIEVDFALLDTLTVQQRVFGTPGNDHDGLVTALYVNGSKNFAYTCQDDTGTGWWRAMDGVPADSARHVFTLDNPNGTVSITDDSGNVLFSESFSTTRTKTDPFTLRLFGGTDTNGVGGVKFNNAASVRIYGCRIWDGGTLVRDYSPHVQDGVAGLYDEQNGTFASIDSANKTYPLRAGGTIVGSSVAGQDPVANGDAYIEGTGSQYLATDYFSNDGTKVEIDFAPTQLGGTRYWFGGVASSAWGSANNLGLYYQRSGTEENLPVRYWTSGNATTTSKLTASLDIMRYRAVVDVPGKTASLHCGETRLANNTVNNFATISTNTVPLWILNAQNQKNGIAIGRIYAFTIYERGERKRSYTPTVQDGVAGLWDSVTKTFIANAAMADGSGFTMHGAGAGGSGMAFVEQPQSGSVSRDGTLTLSAYAPGAVGYLWLKNGELVEGATGRTFEVSYGRGGETDSYQCLAHYDLFGYGLSDAAEVLSVPDTFVIVVR